MQPQPFIIYNVTTKISHSIQKAWLLWMQQYHVPAVIATGCFFKALILKLRDIEEDDGLTYAIQYYAATEADYQLYLSRFSARLRQETIDKWGSQCIAFRTVMEVVN